MPAFSSSVECEEFVESAKALVAHGNRVAGNAAQLQAYLRYHPGQPQAADGCSKPVSVFIGGAAAPGTIGTQQLETEHVRTEAAGRMVVLAMHIVGDGPAKRHIARSRCNRQEPATRHEYGKDVGKQNTSLAGQHPRCFVKGDETVETAHLQQGCTGIEADIAITAAIAIGQ